MITSFAICNKQFISASEEQGKTTQNGTPNLELGGIEAVVLQNQNQQQTNNGSNSSKWARLCGLVTVVAMLSKSGSVDLGIDKICCDKKVWEM